jgi:hypothetical protein
MRWGLVQLKACKGSELNEEKLGMGIMVSRDARLANLWNSDVWRGGKEFKNWFVEAVNSSCEVMVQLPVVVVAYSSFCELCLDLKYIVNSLQLHNKEDVWIWDKVTTSAWRTPWKCVRLVVGNRAMSALALCGSERSAVLFCWLYPY